ncbi:MAG: hypothetical protein QGI21_00105 [Candidatus Poseidoniaceae archaeon]|nr:hypothetical protein [Candidatus Poseidoniaceae archaeon]
MAVLGTGTANGSCSLLHAAGIGYGASLALDLQVKVKIMDKPSKIAIEDPDGLLNAITNSWTSAGHPLPKELFWSIRSSIPPRQGLKSSSAISAAAIRALCDATNITLENHEIVDIASSAQLECGVSITGSIDDTWAALEGGWKLVDVNAEDAKSGLLLESSGPFSEDWVVFLITGTERKERPTLDSFTFHQQAFVQALSALQEGNDLVALTWNGRGVVGALNDPNAKRRTNDAFVSGARAAGISGSGPAIVIFVPAISEQSCERIRKWYSKFPDVEIIETTVINSEMSEE